MAGTARDSVADRSLEHRWLERDIQVLGADGSPLADAEVTVAQERHAVGFGCIGFDLVPLANGDHSRDPADELTFGGARLDGLEQLAELWLGLFDTATLPFYWRGFEPERGAPQTERLRRAARWFVERGVRVKGHPLVWHTLAPTWLRDLPTAEVERLQRERIRREVSAFAGLVGAWDAINEAVIMPVFDREQNGLTRLAREIGRIATVRMAFEEARSADPSVALHLNDFDMSSAYECLVEGVLEAGIRPDGLGLQSHMHQGWWGEDRTVDVLERFSRFGLPLHMTEITLLSGDLMPPEIEDLNDYQRDEWPSTPEGEARQADELVRHYRTLLSHPAVASVTYWGLTDDGAWLGAPAGLVRRDGTPKPAYHALQELVRGEWWVAPTSLRTDRDGRVRVRGWAGDYRVDVGGQSATVSLAASPAEVVARL